MSEGDEISGVEIEDPEFEAFERRLDECDEMFQRWAAGSDDARSNAISTIMVFVTQLAVEHGLGKDEFVKTLGEMYGAGEIELARLDALPPKALEAEMASVVSVNVWSKIHTERGRG
jgi:hypothetical protein